MTKKSNGNGSATGPIYLDGLFEPEYVAVGGKVEKGVQAMLEGYKEFVSQCTGRQANPDRVFQAVLRGGLERDGAYMKWWQKQSQNVATKPSKPVTASDAPVAALAPNASEAAALVNNLGGPK